MKTKTWILLILALIALCYSNIYSNEFLFDDLPAIMENTATEAPINLAKIFLTPSWWSERESGSLKGYRPLATLSFTVNRAIHGLSVEGYHVGNVLLHIANSLLIYFTILTLFNRRLIAGLTSLLFATHPVQSETITGIVARADALAAFFVLLALLSYIKAWQVSIEKRVILLCISATSLLAGLASKESAACLILILLVYEVCFNYFPLKSSNIADKTTRVNKIAIFLIFLIITLGYIFWWRPSVTGQFGDLVMAEGFQPPGLLHNWPIIWRLTAFKIFVYYVRLLVWPVVLSGDYLFNQIPLINKISDPLVLTGICLFFGFLFLGVLSLIKGHVGIAFGIFFFYAAYAPVSNLIIPIGALVGERLLYLPTLGFCVVVAFAFQHLVNLLKEKVSPKKATAIMTTVVSVLIVGYGARTFVRNFDWRNPYVFFEKTSQTSPNSAVSHYSAAVAYLRMLEDTRYIKRWMSAEEFQRLNSENDKGRSLLVGSGLKSISKALEITKEHPNPEYLNVYGALLAMAGKLERAKEVLAEAVRKSPNLVEAKITLGVVYMRLASEMRKTKPKPAGSARQYLTNAVNCFQDVEKRRGVLMKSPIRLAELYFNLSITQEKLGNYDGALKNNDHAFIWLNKAMESTGEGTFLMGRMYVIRASILAGKKNYEEAIEALRKAKDAGFPQFQRYALGMRQFKPLRGDGRFKELIGEK